MITEKIFQRINSHYEQSLEDTVLIGCQHFLEGQYLLIENLLENGLKPENTYLIGKSYSYNQSIRNDFANKGINVYDYTFDSHKEFDEQFSTNLNTFLTQIKQSNITDNKRVVLLDDGGSLISAANKFDFSNTTAVEQTSSGYSRIKSEIYFPIVNVARSKTKLTYETPHVIECFFNNLNPYLNEKKIQPENCLVIGGGTIGEEVKKQAPFKTDIYDTNNEKSYFKNKQLKDILPDYDMIIGATGNKSIPKELHKNIKKDAILVSISSSDREFDAVHLRKKTSVSNNPHQHYYENGIHLLNSGFPMTFTGSRVAAPTEKIIMTQALMLSGLYESLKYENNEMYGLSDSIQKIISMEVGLQ